jgi:hypothetical protein
LKCSECGGVTYHNVFRVLEVVYEELNSFTDSLLIQVVRCYLLLSHVVAAIIYYIC